MLVWAFLNARCQIINLLSVTWIPTAYHCKQLKSPKQKKALQRSPLLGGLRVVYYSLNALRGKNNTIFVAAKQLTENSSRRSSNS